MKWQILSSKENKKNISKFYQLHHQLSKIVTDDILISFYYFVIESKT